MYSWRLSSIAAAFALFVTPASTAEIRIVGLAGMAPLMKEIGPVFERESGHKIIPRYGSGADGRRIIETGEAFDIAVLNPLLIRMFSEQGKIVEGTARELFRNGTGVAVRAGATKPDISTPDAFKAAVLNAQTIAYSPGRASGIHVEKILGRLGVAEQVKSKTKAQPAPEDVASAVARGEAEMGFAAMNLLVGIPGTEVVGPFPMELQEYIVFAAALSASPQDRTASNSLINFLQSEAARTVMRRQGLEPL